MISNSRDLKDIEIIRIFICLILIISSTFIINIYKFWPAKQIIILVTNLINYPRFLAKNIQKLCK